MEHYKGHPQENNDEFNQNEIHLNLKQRGRRYVMCVGDGCAPILKVLDGLEDLFPTELLNAFNDKLSIV